ncbi:class I SAM-dependent methyltransferase [Francisella adeliensis]|uniref:SAM-dependent methyltransferase n=1 Tax=Francisella adeliensis TaxID=2007306 RepID=A0A2Z4XXA0_9GAMM|nr:class I SAM-dependent methyltransferase [Francisella adeliensis]AXA33346.1 SAM-dependent methyltransferase [Francisella adeliensis]MBK2085358.1 class I SAM-dependent methyltransferase [Francisella adeliensis]MBK2097088.1 class I SAM-dependent methyltransferase [Francisella adeliensis]QIW11574.1 class I SAM-dependent methyltransferase [Francisella adeliensis]QIW13449.1 class I SAM-dependent methyltransferase [Francisella adeliensis]
MSNKSSDAGQKIYSKTVLKIYNFWVLFFNNRFLWKCKTSNLVDLYSKNVSRNHLDVGVGSGYLLNKVRNKLDKVTLMDLNPTCLDYVENVLKDKEVSKVQTDILVNVPESFHNQFDSIGANYLIHCLPDNNTKDMVFKNLAKMLKSTGVAFGSTIINGYDSKMAINVADKFNKKGIFDNENDSYEKIEQYIKENFENHEISQVGSVCIFSMSHPIK